MNTLTIISVLVSIISFLIATTISAWSKPKYAGESLIFPEENDYVNQHEIEREKNRALNAKWISRFSGRNRFVKTGRNEKHSKSRRNETTI